MKLWPAELRLITWEWLLPVIKRVLLDISPEAFPCWEAFFKFALVSVILYVYKRLIVSPDETRNVWLRLSLSFLMIPDLNLILHQMLPLSNLRSFVSKLYSSLVLDGVSVKSLNLWLRSVSTIWVTVTKQFERN